MSMPKRKFGRGESLPAKYVSNIATSPRICLTCYKEFQSTGPGNRKCPACVKSPKVGDPELPEDRTRDDD